MKYPRIEQYGLSIDGSHSGIPGIQFEDLREKLSPLEYEAFNEMHLGQTFGDNGAYVYDVEAILERMQSGRLTGTQLHWD